MPPLSKTANESAFCAICEPSKLCWLEPRSSRQHKKRRSLARRSRAWCSAPANWALSPVSPMRGFCRERAMHPAFQEVIHLLYAHPTRLSIRAIAEHVELKRVASRVQQDTGTAIPLPSYDQVRAYVKTLKQEPKVRQEREQLPRLQRDLQYPRSFALSIPAPAQLLQVDEHSMELSVIT